MHLILSYLLTAIVFFVIDLIWLGLIAKEWYAHHMGHLMRDSVNWPVAIIFYLLFVVGLFIFAIIPGVERSSIQTTMVYGALFGFFTYATYDLTNLAVLKNFPAGVVAGDILWGVVLSTLVSCAGYFISKWVQTLW